MVGENDGIILVRCGLNMKHCKSCVYCELDLVSQYVKGIDYYKCILTNEHIQSRFFDGRDCTLYCKRTKKNLFVDERNFIQLR